MNYNLIFILMPFIYGVLLLGLSMYKLDFLLIFINYLIFGKLFNFTEKQIFKKIQGENNILGKRPNPLGTEILKGKYDKCSIPINEFKPWKLKVVDKDYFKDGKNKPSWGFPSGHAQETSFVATFLTLYNLNHNTKHKYIYITILWIINILTMNQRVSIGCHTLLQVIVGNLFGIGWGILSYYICHKIYPDKFPDNYISKLI